MGASGDGFVTLADGSRRWGRFGAAGILLRHVDVAGEPHYFVALRSAWTHKGGTWAMPGGALDEGEQPLEGALREFSEEIGHRLEEFEVVEVHEDDHGGWSYWTLVLDVPSMFEAQVTSWETAECRWVSAAELAKLDLFDAFRATCERLGFL